MAYIDSGNSSMQILQSDFENLFKAMQTQVNSIQKDCKIDEFGENIGCSLKSNEQCSQLQESLSPLEFYIQDSKITILPSGILDDVPEVIDETTGEIITPRHCLIGIESIPDSENHYRLGIQFLKNFYTALDYQNNVIMIALNDHGKNSGADAVVDPTGKQPPQATAANNYEPLVALIVFAIVLTLSSMAFHKHRAMKKQKL